MFTGLIEDIGTIRRLQKTRNGMSLVLASRLAGQNIQPGESISVNGVCLTVTDCDKDDFRADAVPETLRRTNLGSLKPGDRVNLERAIKADGRFGGHLVTGHIDGTGVISDMLSEGNAIRFTIEADASILRYLVPKGSVGLDGISLTVSSVSPETFSVEIIPFTLRHTTLSFKKPGDKVNIECDMLGKYVEKFLGRDNPSREEPELRPGIDLDFLKKHGFAE
jgi:riboflavin synthase